MVSKFKLRSLHKALFALTVSAAAFGAGVLQAQTQHNISAANLKVVQFDETNATNSLSVTTPITINDFRIRDGSNRGDYNVQIGASANDDLTTGVLMTSVAENGRDNGETNYPGINFCTSAIEYIRTGANAGSFYIPIFQAPTGDEYNINVSAAFFPYTNWLGGYARNSGDTNGGANDLLTASPGLVLGTHFVDNGGGQSTVNLTSRGFNSQTDGVLLVTHGKNEDNYALSHANPNGTWTVFVKDNGTDAGSYEQDPVAFVFIPKTNTTVVSGKFRGDGTPMIFSGSTPQFSVTNTSTGVFRLTVNGHSPSDGVLVISAEGGTTYNQDNIVTFEPNGDGWLIQSRDLPASPPNLQTPTPATEAVASFVFIPAKISASVISPADNAQNQPMSPTLKVNVSGASNNPVNLSFYGRVASSNPATDFAIVALPDTQFYTDSAHGGLPAMFYAQTEWIITNRVSRNIAYVAQLGDLVDHGDNNGGNPAAEWRVATNAMYRMEDPVRTFIEDGIPYGVAVGNHDESPNGHADGTTTFYNQYFGVPHFDGRSYYAGHYGTNNDNHYDFFSAGGMDFVVLYFKYDTNANPAVLAWGNSILQNNPQRRAIVITHNFGNTQTPLKFSAQGLAIYNALKGNSNLFLMLAGHVTGEGSRVDTFNGNTVRTYVQDYQGWTNGGNGFMRIYYFSPANNQVVAQTYSPYTGEYETDANSEFFFSYNMQEPVGATNELPFNLISTVNNITTNGEIDALWSNRQLNTPYEWYVVTTEGSSNVTTSSTFRFSTAPNSAPIVSNQVIIITGDAATNLTLAAYDANGDALTFFTNSFPTHGLNQNFNPNAGTITYVPTRGFRGFDRFLYHVSDGAFTSSVVTLNLNVMAPPDSDSDGLPDAWESAFGVTNALADDDNDGQNNLGEYLSNTNPTNAASSLRINQATRAANGFVTLTWPTVGGTRYRLQFSNASTNGSFSGVFTDIVRPLEAEISAVPYGTSDTQNFVDDFTVTGGSTNTARYYRIKVVP